MFEGSHLDAVLDIQTLSKQSFKMKYWRIIALNSFKKKRKEGWKKRKKCFEGDEQCLRCRVDKR